MDTALRFKLGGPNVGVPDFAVKVTIAISCVEPVMG